ncbi:MAG: ribonuclease H-like domain-containing protein [Armatimonadota bacterium]
MLTATFLHGPGIGGATEKSLWAKGLRSWADFLGAANPPLSKAKAGALRPIIEASVEALERKDAGWFANILPAREHWRLLPWFGERIAYLDIETTGGMEPDDITVIGVHDGYECRVLLKHEDLDEFPSLIRDAQMLVTFFGTGFDLPFLRRRFPDLALDQPHVDLCPTLRRLGHSGGLKAIERRLGIPRRDEVDGLDGMDAVRLWDIWRRRRDEEARRLLIAYNREDVENLETLLTFALPRLTTDSGFPGAAVT